jgi:DNA-directed RNA polymerase specialized sigma24 family protein
MRTPYESPAPSPRHAPLLRPGRKLGPVVGCVSSSHRAWLMPIRRSYLRSGRTLSDLSDHVLLAKSKLSELLRGLGHYPRWEVVHRLSVELNMPSWPLYRLWRRAAFDANKTREWIDRSAKETAVATSNPPHPPLEHGALRQMVEVDYRYYASAFLPDDVCEAAVEETFAVLWLSWNDGLASADIRRFAWNVFRTTVMGKATYRDGLPELENSVFDTVALRSQTSQTARMTQLTESLELFKAISKLPDAQLDVMVLRHLCGLTDQRTSELLGVPLATVRSDERHATRYLECAIHMSESEGPTA